MFGKKVSKYGAFYERYLPLGDRLGEMFYAVWMVVVSLGILGSTELGRSDIALVIIVAFGVNITWGLIDGISVMHTNIIERARSEKLVHSLRTRNDDVSRNEAMIALDDSVTMSLGEEDRRKVVDLIAAGDPGPDPSKKRYYAGRDDWYYALGILGIDVLLVFPLIVPLLIWPDPRQAIYITRLVATVIFALLGAAYAQNLNRRKWVAALFLGTLCFLIFTLVFLTGW